LLLLAILIGAVGVAGFRGVEARQARAHTSESEERLAALRARAAQLLRDRDRLEAAEQALRQAAAELAKGSAAAGATPPQPAPVARRAFDVNLLMAERPELRPLYEVSAKAAEMEPYGWLIVSLTPEAAERFTSERLRHDQRLSEINKASRAEGWERDNPQRVALRQAEEAQHGREVAAAIGDERLPEYQAYEKTLRPRDFAAGELARQLYYTESPLSEAQARALTEVLVRHGTTENGRFDFDAVRWEPALEEARGILAPTQFERLANLSEMRRLQSRVLAIEREFGARVDGK
jgi:hypothetical protein